MIKAFISHNFADNPVENKNKVDKICKDLVKKYPNILPISPLHTFSFLEKDGNYRNEIMNWCYQQIKNCELFLVYGTNNGCQLETAYAVKDYKKVYAMTDELYKFYSNYLVRICTEKDFVEVMKNETF